jgi:SAM-dependent methyltransferase
MGGHVSNLSAEIYDELYSWKDYDGEASHVRDRAAQLHPEARTLLDVCCGTGSHLLTLKRWYEVEGFDIDQPSLDVAARRMPDVPLHQGDMRDFDLGRTFDVITCFFGSIAYAQTTDGLAQAARAMARHLAPGGVMLVEPWHSPSTYKLTFPGRLMTANRPDLQAVRVSVARVEDKSSVVDLHFLVARPGVIEHFTETHVMGLFTPGEYLSAFEAAGLAAELDPNGYTGRGLWICRSSGD